MNWSAIEQGLQLGVGIAIGYESTHLVPLACMWVWVRCRSLWSRYLVYMAKAARADEDYNQPPQ